jgi:hypothetical protein
MRVCVYVCEDLPPLCGVLNIPVSHARAGILFFYRVFLPIGKALQALRLSLGRPQLKRKGSYLLSVFAAVSAPFWAPAKSH